MQQLPTPAILHDDVDGGVILPGTLQGDHVERAPELAQDSHLPLDVGHVGCLAGRGQVRQVQGLGDRLAGELRAGRPVSGDADLGGWVHVSE